MNALSASIRLSTGKVSVNSTSSNSSSAFAGFPLELAEVFGVVLLVRFGRSVGDFSLALLAILIAGCGLGLSEGGVTVTTDGLSVDWAVVCGDALGEDAATTAGVSE